VTSPKRNGLQGLLQQAWFLKVYPLCLKNFKPPL